MAKKYGPAYGKTAKNAIKAMISSGAVVKVSAKRGRKPKVSNTVKDYVDKAIDKASEDKHALQNVFSSANCVGGGFNNTTSKGLTTAISIIPLITQGTTVSNRIGNRINVKSLNIRMVLEARPVQTNNAIEGLPFYVRVVFYNRKDSMTNNTNDTILDLGGSSTAFTFSNASLLLKYNTDLFNIISSKTYKMAPCQGMTDAGVSSERNPPNGFVSHVLKTFKIKCPKRLQYDDTSSNPMHRIYCAIGVVNADGSDVFPATNGSRLQVSMDSHIVYEDN